MSLPSSNVRRQNVGQNWRAQFNGYCFALIASFSRKLTIDGKKLLLLYQRMITIFLLWPSRIASYSSSSSSSFVWCRICFCSIFFPLHYGWLGEDCHACMHLGAWFFFWERQTHIFESLVERDREVVSEEFATGLTQLISSTHTQQKLTWLVGWILACQWNWLMIISEAMFMTQRESRRRKKQKLRHVIGNVMPGSKKSCDYLIIRGNSSICRELRKFCRELLFFRIILFYSMVIKDMIKLETG